MTYTCNIHEDIKRGLHPVHLLRKYHLNPRELSCILSAYAGINWTSEAPRERGHSYWKAYFARNKTLSVR